MVSFIKQIADILGPFSKGKIPEGDIVLEAPSEAAFENGLHFWNALLEQTDEGVRRKATQRFRSPDMAEPAYDPDSPLQIISPFAFLPIPAHRFDEETQKGRVAAADLAVERATAIQMQKFLRDFLRTLNAGYEAAKTRGVYQFSFPNKAEYARFSSLLSGMKHAHGGPNAGQVMFLRDNTIIATSDYLESIVDGEKEAIARVIRPPN